MNHVAVRIDRSFHLKLAPIGATAVEARLTRLGAQQLGQALLEYAGVAAKSCGRGPVTVVAAQASDNDEDAVKRQPRTVRL